MRKRYFEIEYEVSGDRNIYSLLLSLYGREAKEYEVPSPFGAGAFREWENGIYVFRKIEYDFLSKKFVMKDKVGIPINGEFLDLIRRIKQTLSAHAHERKKR